VCYVQAPSGVTVYCVTFKLRDSPEVCENVFILKCFALQIIFKTANQIMKGVARGLVLK